MFDIETLFEKINTFFKENLNSKIVDINNEKGDKLLTSFPGECYISGSLDEKIMNYDNVCFSYIESIEATSNGAAVSKKVIVEVDLLFNQKYDFMDYKRILRYQRALLDCAILAWGKVALGYSDCNVVSLNPIDVKLFNSSHWTKVIGIQIEFNIN